MSMHNAVRDVLWCFIKEYIDPNALLAPEAAPGAPMVPFPRYRNAMPEQAPSAPIETTAASEE